MHELNFMPYVMMMNHFKSALHKAKPCKTFDWGPRAQDLELWGQDSLSSRIVEPEAKDNNTAYRDQRIKNSNIKLLLCPLP